MKSRGWGPVGQEVVGVNQHPLSESFSMLLLIGVDVHRGEEYRPVVPQFLTRNVTALDILEFFVICVENGYLVDGDTVLLDNARIHTSSEYLPLLVDMLSAHNINLRFLPKYSPELNPIEQVFATIKNRIRNTIFELPMMVQVLVELSRFHFIEHFVFYLHSWSGNHQ